MPVHGDFVHKLEIFSSQVAPVEAVFVFLQFFQHPALFDGFDQRLMPGCCELLGLVDIFLLPRELLAEFSNVLQGQRNLLGGQRAGLAVLHPIDTFAALLFQTLEVFLFPQQIHLGRVQLLLGQFFFVAPVF